jgi:cell wall-associated NlpC family hydrolase
VRRLLVPLALVLLAPLASAAQARPTRADWNLSEQKQVLRADVMTKAGGSFGGALSRAAQVKALRTLAARGTGVTEIAVPSRPLTLARFDAQLVQALGLSDVAGAIRAEAARAGLRPSPIFGTEVVARWLDLREDHPFGDDALELSPGERITRAEAAHSYAQILGFRGWEAESTRETFASFRLPAYSAAQRQALRVAVSKVGMPYIWGGEADGTYNRLTGWQAHGGYDCSGLVWRVFKLTGFAAGKRIRGRTAAQMAGEIPKARRLRISQLRGGDLLFFGSAKFGSKATEASITHTAISLGNDWVVQSSSQGVTVVPLEGGWLGRRFAWARRVL